MLNEGKGGGMPRQNQQVKGSEKVARDGFNMNPTGGRTLGSMLQRKPRI